MLKHENEKFLDLKSLGQILLTKSITATVKWCENHNIKIQIIGNKKVVSKFMVDMEIDIHLVKELKTKYPLKWEELYRCYQDNDRLGYLILIDDNPELDLRPISKRIVPTSKFAKDFANS